MYLPARLNTVFDAARSTPLLCRVRSHEHPHTWDTRPSDRRTGGGDVTCNLPGFLPFLYLSLKMENNALLFKTVLGRRRVRTSDR